MTALTTTALTTTALTTTALTTTALTTTALTTTALTTTALTTTAPAAADLARAPDDVRMPAHRRPGHTIVALSGALDSPAAPALREHLISALRYSGRLLILDLREVASADVVGLAVLVGIQRRAAGLGITLRLAAPGRQVTAQLRLTAFDRTLTVHPTLDVHAEIAAIP